MKKICALIMSGAIAISGLTALLASAENTEKNNILSISSKSISENLVLSDGNVIPAGSTALTVSISNNTGFNVSTTRLNIGEADVLVDITGNPIVSKDVLFEDSTVVSVTNDNLIAVSSILDDDTFDDGEMFTIYTTSMPSNVSVCNISDAYIRSVQNNTRDTVYHIGDVNVDGFIDSVDASQVARAYETYCGNPYGALPVSIANANLTTYFPYIPDAEIADTNQNDYINHTDKSNILIFYTYLSVDFTMEEAMALVIIDGNHCGEEWS